MNTTTPQTSGAPAVEGEATNGAPDTYTCPWCGTTEPNAFLLQNNHWVKTPRGSGFDWCAEHGLCIAMHLTRNHVLYYVRRLIDPTVSDLCACSSSRHAPRADCARDALRRSITRAEQVWPADRLDWLDEYRPLAAEPEVPQHHHVPESQQEALL